MKRRAVGIVIVALVVPVLAGLGFMAWQAAPHAYLAANAGALLIALVLAAVLPMPRSERSAALLVAALLATLWATTLFGMELDGVKRWFGAGPASMHAGYLVLPLFAVLVFKLRSAWSAGVVALAAIATAVQPDAATATGVAILAIVIAIRRCDTPSVGGMVVALACCAAALTRGVSLAPVRFVEFVPQQAWSAAPIAGLALIFGQLGAIGAIASRGRTATGLTAFLLGCTAVSWLAPYPSLLIGYGAAAILGLSLALAALR